MEKAYSAGLAEAIENFLAHEGIRHQSGEVDGLFEFRLDTRIGFPRDCVGLKIKVGPDWYEVVASSPTLVDKDEPEEMGKAAEYLARINKARKGSAGHFELGFVISEPRYVLRVKCQGKIPDEKEIKASVWQPAAALDAFMPGLKKIEEGLMDPAEAARKCLKKN